MDHFLSVLLDFPESSWPADNAEYHKAARQHIQKLEQLMKDNGQQFSGLAAQLLEHVNPAVNSISYLALLQTVLARDKAPQTSNTLLSCVVRFLLTFDSRQIRYVGLAFSTLLTAIEEGELFPASVAVELLAKALLRFDPTGSMLTSHHLPLVNLAYATDNVDLILPVIDKTIVFYPGMKGVAGDTRYPCDMQLPPTAYITVDGFTGKLSSAAVLRYDFLCALCYISRQSWQQAFDALERVISYPTKDSTCSKLMAEAYNKWLLVGLLLTGKTPDMPALTYGGPQKAYATLGKPYASVAKAFQNETAQALKAEFDTLGSEFWAEEGNLGLINMVLSHYQRWKIVELRTIYSKISLEEIRQLTQSAETGAPLETEADILHLIEDMIEGGMLKGVLVPATDGKPAHLEFLSAAEDLSEREFAEKMEQIRHRVKQLGPIIKATNDRLTTSREYLRFLAKDQKSKDKDGITPGSFMGFESQIDDEDLMTGVLAGH